MPMFVSEHAPDGEGIYVEPVRRSRRADRSAAELVRFRRDLVWYKLRHKNDWSAVEIAESFARSVSAVQAALARMHGWLIERGYVQDAEYDPFHVPPLEPFYG